MSKTETITVEVPIEEALNGETREESNLDDEAIEDFVGFTKDIERGQKLRELARDRVDKDEITRADTLLWIDAAEVYALCADHYTEKAGGAWTGSTSNPGFTDLRERMVKEIQEGRHCVDCYNDRLDEVEEEIEEEVEIVVEVVE